MKIAVLSGKGGTGKTLVSVNLAAVRKQSVYIDCDVEEPNGHLFFKPEKVQKENIYVPIPQVNEELCDGCRKCVDFCKFNALAYLKDRILVFEEVCHSCGGCTLVCPKNAISEKEKMIGTIQKGLSQEVTVKSGILNTGEVSGIPIIHKLLEETMEEQDVFIDCPPGSACTVMESIKDADYCVLVAEPTIFGVHNLKMVHELVTFFEKPFGVLLNKCLEDAHLAEKYCIENGIKILGKIPYDEELGTLNSNGHIAARERETFHELFSTILKTVRKEAQHETTVNP